MRILLAITALTLLIGCGAREPQPIRCDRGTPELKFFSGSKGNGEVAKPAVFYHRIGSRIYCFDGDGYDPRTGDKLHGVTREIRTEILGQPCPPPLPPAPILPDAPKPVAPQPTPTPEPEPQLPELGQAPCN
jgi:hypothetical protein